MTETEISKKFTEALKKQRVLVFKIHGHSYQAPGWPDMYIAFPNGVQCWVETKGVETNLSDLQARRITDLRNRGVCAFVLRFVSDTMFICEDEYGKLLRAFKIKSWKDAAEQFIGIAENISHGFGTSARMSDKATG